MYKILQVQNALNFLLQNENKYLLHKTVQHKNRYFASSMHVCCEKFVRIALS